MSPRCVSSKIVFTISERSGGKSSDLQTVKRGELTLIHLKVSSVHSDFLFSFFISFFLVENKKKELPEHLKQPI